MYRCEQSYKDLAAYVLDWGVGGLDTYNKLDKYTRQFQVAINAIKKTKVKYHREQFESCFSLGGQRRYSTEMTFIANINEKHSKQWEERKEKVQYRWKLAQKTVKNSGKPYLNQVMKVNIIIDIPWILCTPWYTVSRRVLSLYGVLSKGPGSQSNHEKNNKQNQVGEHPTWGLSIVPQDC